MRLRALLAALEELFGPRLSFGPVETDPVGELLPILWDRVEAAKVWIGYGIPYNDPTDLARHVFNGCHEAVLETMGRHGEPPGVWANAVPGVTRAEDALRLRLVLGEDEVAAVLVPLA